MTKRQQAPSMGKLSHHVYPRKEMKECRDPNHFMSLCPGQVAAGQQSAKAESLCTDATQTTGLEMPCSLHIHSCFVLCPTESQGWHPNVLNTGFFSFLSSGQNSQPRSLCHRCLLPLNTGARHHMLTTSVSHGPCYHHAQGGCHLLLVFTGK